MMISLCWAKCAILKKVGLLKAAWIMCTKDIRGKVWKDTLDPHLIDISINTWSASPLILDQHLIDTSTDSRSTVDSFLQTPHWVSIDTYELVDTANYQLTVYQVLIECWSRLNQGYWSTLDRGCLWYTWSSSSHKVSLEWLDTLWEDNRTNNRNNVSNPKTITAANKKELCTCKSCYTSAWKWHAVGLISAALSGLAAIEPTIKSQWLFVHAVSWITDCILV